MKRTDEYLRLLRGKGLRATNARIALLKALRAAGRPMSAEELHAKVPTIDLVTVYRILQQFVPVGLARECRFKDSKLRYEFGITDHHHHLVCTDCGAVDELEGCGAGFLEKKILSISPRFATVNEHVLEFFGTCKSCARN